ncbi:MAG: nitroreductase family protein [Candidatus Bipolaricaulota bacterium]
MSENQVLQTIKGRRSVHRFKQDPVTDEQLNSILEAGRWAPSFANTQPWSFLVIKDPNTKEDLMEVVERVTIAREGVSQAPVLVAVLADPLRDPRHYLEAAAVAAHNMTLAAQSLGLGSYWIGMYDPSGGRNTAEAKMKKLLGVPREFRLVALLPIGVPAQVPEKDREPLRSTVRYEKFA